MKKYLTSDIILPVAVIFVLTAVLLNILADNDEQATVNRVAILAEIHTIAETAYAEGQRDYANNDVRINTQRNCWLVSPWDDNTTIKGPIKLCPKDN